jgi:hypothetical protein
MTKKIAPVEALAYFIDGGFQGRKESEIINGFFVAKKYVKKMEKKFTDFETGGSTGANSGDMRILLTFNKRLLDSSKYEGYQAISDAGKILSYYSKDELEFAASYIVSEKTHLYPKEAEIAEKVLGELDFLFGKKKSDKEVLDHKAVLNLSKD